MPKFNIMIMIIITQVICYDWDSDGSHDTIGEFMTSLAELTAAHSSRKKLDWECINNEKKKKKKKYKNSGTVHAEVKVRRMLEEIACTFVFMQILLLS